VSSLSALQPLHLHHFPIRADHQPQLTGFVFLKDPSTQCLGEELVGRIIAVNEVLDLFIRHAGASFLAQVHFLLQPPLVDVLQILRVDVDKGVQLVG
jgi:hypothetical protein